MIIRKLQIDWIVRGTITQNPCTLSVQSFSVIPAASRYSCNGIAGGFNVEDIDELGSDAYEFIPQVVIESDALRVVHIQTSAVAVVENGV